MWTSSSERLPLHAAVLVMRCNFVLRGIYAGLGFSVPVLKSRYRVSVYTVLVLILDLRVLVLFLDL